MSAGAIEAGKAFVRILADDTDLGKGLQKAQNKLKLFAASTGQLGRQLATMIAPLAAVGTAGAKMFADFEQQMAQVSTLVDDKTLMPGFAEGIKRLAVEFGESKDVLAAGLRDILGAAIDPAKAMDVLTVSVRAAKAALTDTSTATDAITTVLAAYNLDVEKAGDVSDWLFRVADRGKTTFPELAAGIGNVATTAASAGVSLDELGAMLSLLTRAGIKSDNAITSLNSIISTFLDASPEAAAAAENLGFELSTATLQAEGLAGVFKRIASLPPEAIAKLFPDARAIKGVLPAIRNMQSLDKDLAAMAGRAGATQAAWEALADAAKTKFQQMREAIIQASEEIGEALIGDLKKAADGIKQIGVYIADWIEKHQALVKVLGASTLLVAAISGGLMALSAAASGAAVALGGLTLAGKAASASLAFLVAHPAVAVLAAIAVTAVAMGVAMDYAAASTLGLADAQASLLAKGDKRRKQDMEALNRLQYLSQQEALSNKEKTEAITIIDRLQGRYGDLGLSMDETTGKIRGVTSAFEDMAAMMRSDAEKNIRSALREATTNAALAAEEINRLKDAWMSRSSKESEVARWTMEMERENLKAKELQRRLEELKAENTEAALGTGGTAAVQTGSYGAAVMADKAAAKGAADYAADLAERMHQAKLAMIADEEQREHEAIRSKHLAELEAARKANRDIAALQSVQAAEVAVVQTEHQRKRAAEAKRDEEEKARNRKDMAEEIEELQIKTTSDGLEEQLKLLELERKRAIAEAPISGQSVGEINRLFSLRALLAKQGDVGAAIDKRASVSGTFSAQMATRMQGSAVEERQLKAQEGILQNTADMKRQLGGMGKLR